MTINLNTLEGLISILGDENYTFRKKEHIWKDAADEQTGYPKFNQDNGISDYNDFFLDFDMEKAKEVAGDKPILSLLPYKKKKVGE